jgi:diguanylate cyclase (GGDEF)-like protein/PAS domain S-box-containing protein
VSASLEVAIGMKPRVIPVGPDVSPLLRCLRLARLGRVPQQISHGDRSVSTSRNEAPVGLDMDEAHVRSEPMASSFAARLRAEIDRRMAATPAMLHSIDEFGRIVSVSDAWLAKLGYAREEVLGRLSSDFLDAESRAFAIKHVLPEFFRTGRVENVQYRMLKKCGEAIDVLMSGVLADPCSDEGRVSLAVVTDITPLLDAKRRLVESEARYRSLVEDQSELVSLSTPQGELRYVNEAYASHYGRRAEEMVGKNLLDFVAEEERAEVAGRLARICASAGKGDSENRVVLPDGRARWFAWTNRAILDAEGRVTVVHSVGRDIQDRVDAERRLQASEARYRFLAEHSTDMILLVDRDGNRIYASPASRKLLGLEPEETIALRLQDAIHPDDAQRVLPVLGANPADTVLTYRMRRKDGGYVWVETTGKTVEIDGGERQRLIIVRDVSARKMAEDRLAEAHARLEVLSSQDSLTGLANRRTFDETLASEYRRAELGGHAVALMMIDVDRFKAFNDRYGHPAGDACLRRVATAIAGAIRRPADVAARYGGEEFAVVLPGTDEAGAMTVAANIQRAVRQLEIEHRDSEWEIATISIGVASVRPGVAGESMNLLLQQADRALYGAKSGGRNSVTPASLPPAAPQAAVAA